MTAMETSTLVLEGERPLSWNKLYAGLHFRQRADYAAAKHLQVVAAVREQFGIVTPVARRVRLTVRAYFDHHPMDASNICAKLYEDGLVAAGVLFDDSPQYVAAMTTESYIDKRRPRVEIEITEVAE